MSPYLDVVSIFHRKKYGSSDISLLDFKAGDYPIYSGLALMRKWDGKKFVDDNNSTSDFEVKVATLSRKDASGNPIK